MDKHPQDKFFSLAIVRSSGQKLRPLPVGPRWWGPPSPRRIAMQAAEPVCVPSLATKKIAVMPAQPHNFLLSVLRRLRRLLFHFGNKVRVQTETQAVTNLLAFRRTRGMTIAQPERVGKMPSGSVAWGGDQKSSLEGGRR